MKRIHIIAAFMFIVCVANFLASSSVAAADGGTKETQYLLFQIFTYPDDQSAGSAFFPAQGRLSSVVQEIVQSIGVKGNGARKLGICLGPLTLNQSDAQIKRLIEVGFSLAKQNAVAIAFHIDDQMFWDGRADLASSDNHEWIDWAGTVCKNRRLDWGPQPARAPAQLCLNSPAVQAAVRQRAALIGREIAKNVAQLNAEHRGQHFAGVIAGWESMIGRDFDGNRRLGYHALHNLAMTARNSRDEADRALVGVVRKHVELWCNTLVANGVPPDRVYSHIAGIEANASVEHNGMSFVEAVGFAPPEVAFDKSYRPGFSTYPGPDVLDNLHKLTAKYGRSTPWISAEGTNVVPNGMEGEANMESYLAKLFNHNAVAVTIFGWGVGGESQREGNIFRRATEGPEAIAAYRKFLQGAQLRESPIPSGQLSPQNLRDKVHRIQAELAQWVQRTGQQQVAEQHMQRLDAAIKSNDFKQAHQVSDEIIKMIEGGR